MKKLIPLMIATGLALTTALPCGAHADNLNLFAGSNLGAHERGLIVAEYVLPMIAEVGPFISYSNDTAFGTENRITVGTVGRMTLPWLNFFADMRLGYNDNSTSLGVSDSRGFLFEPGVGYRFSLPTTDLLVRLGFNAVAPSSHMPLTNLTAGLVIIL